MGPLAAILLPFVPGIIRGVELAFARLPKSGPFKLQTALNMLGSVAEGMLGAQAPLPDGSLIPDKSVKTEELKAIIETTLVAMKTDGTLGGVPQSGVKPVSVPALVFVLGWAEDKTKPAAVDKATKDLLLSLQVAP